MAFFNPNPTIPVVPFTPELAEPLSFRPIQPILMFPVRLETRFFSLPEGGVELRVRVYPDKVHFDTHEPELTDQEIIWGKHFWEQTWRAANDEEARKLAWRQLVERFDAGRAAWVARALKPLNPNDRPAQPVPGEQPLPIPINLPSPATRTAAWTRAPYTSVLPKRWYVLGYAGGGLVVRAVGNEIPDKLVTGPDPTVAFDNFAAGELPIDDGMKWMVDFDEAEKVGMGIRVRLTTDQAALGFDILLVFGTRVGADVGDSTGDLVRLLEAHHYSDGLSFVLQGTPSNNTPDAPSGFSSSDTGQEESYLAERAGTKFQAGDGSNADALATALGLRNENALTLANLANANAAEQTEARHMNRALWSATWGYFLLQMMGAPLTVEDSNWARQHFIDYVRSAGPLPAVRVGRQPYGILPVTSLNIWKAKTGQEQQSTRDAAVKDFLTRLREIWRANLTQVPRVGQNDNPDQDLANIFSMDGISSSYTIRHLMGETYLRELWSFLVPGDQTVWWNKQRELTTARLNAVGLNWDPRLSHATYSGWHTSLKGPVAQAEPLSENAPLTPNYIELLLNEPDLEKVHTESFSEFTPKSLLYSLLRHNMLLEYGTAAASLSAAQNTLASAASINREAEIVSAETPTVWQTLSKPVAGVTNDSAWSFLFGLQGPPPDPTMASQVASLLEFRESLAHLKSLSASKLQRLCAGSLDLCSHRLDAWITSFATKRLAEMRREHPTGLLLGGYGWVMNLKPAASFALEVPPIGEQGVFLRPTDNPGYTHTPSLAQASTVAVLRSGHLTHSDAGTKDLLAIDLSSERVRLAAWLLDGVRQGQPLGALLGYRFERRLQEARLGQFIPYFREVAPLVANKLEQTDQPVESIAANNVVDGLALQRKWKNLPRVVSFTLLTPLQMLFIRNKKQPNPALLRPAEAALLAELELLDQAVDALSDALTAESVHHAVQGNPLRTASTLDAIASGETPPPELEVVHTPRTGVALTHRLVTLFSDPPTVPPEWNSSAISHRANAEPNLNSWAARLLGNPTRVRCVIERIDPATGEVAETKELRLNELQLAPIDFIYAAEGGRDAEPSELERRIQYAIMRKPDGFPQNATLRINPNRVAGWPTSELSYGEFKELLKAARRLITGARGLDASELSLPEQNQPAAVNLTELQARADKAALELSQTRTRLQGLLDSGSTANLEELREGILRSAQFAVAGAVPFSATGDAAADRDALLQQGGSIAKEMGARRDQLATLETDFGKTRATDDDRREHQIARLRVAFGNSFVVLPQFSAGNAAELEKALADSSGIQDNDPLAVATWFQRASRVRDGVARLDASSRYAEVLETGESLNLKVAQLPYREADRWVGLPLKPGQALSPSRFSLVVQAAATLDVKQPLTGLLIDEWVEVVPNAVETTGLVFQYDQPDAAPPQCILLAVPPDPDQVWNLWSLQQVLLETLDLARIRAVDPEALDEVGHYLPALYFAINPVGETVSTDFARLK